VGGATVLDLAWDSLRETACRVANRDLTSEEIRRFGIDRHPEGTGGGCPAPISSGREPGSSGP
jgi:hypothetical protein